MTASPTGCGALDADQRAYAAADVAHLLELHDRLVEALEEEGRLAWVLDECEQLRSRSWAARDPDEAWLRIKEARHLRGPAVGVARSVAAWRSAGPPAPTSRSDSSCRTSGWSASPSACLGTRDQVRGIRGVDERHLRGTAVDELLAAAAEGRANPAARPRAAEAEELDRSLRPAVTLVSAWLGQMSRDLRIEASLLATRADIEALLLEEEGARLTRGWRAELVGEPIRRLVAGQAALSFDGHGGLLLEERSGRAISPPVG